MKSMKRAFAKFINFIWNDHKCGILFIIQHAFSELSPFKVGSSYYMKHCVVMGNVNVSLTLLCMHVTYGKICNDVIKLLTALVL